MDLLKMIKYSINNLKKIFLNDLLNGEKLFLKYIHLLEKDKITLEDLELMGGAYLVSFTDDIRKKNKLPKRDNNINWNRVEEMYLMI